MTIKNKKFDHCADCNTTVCYGTSFTACGCFLENGCFIEGNDGSILCFDCSVQREEKNLANQPSSCQQCHTFWGLTVAPFSSQQCSKCKGYFCCNSGKTCFETHECITSPTKKRTMSEIDEETPSSPPPSPKKTKHNEEDSDSEEDLSCCFCGAIGTDDDLFYCSAVGCENWFCDNDCTVDNENGPIINAQTAIQYCSLACQEKTERKKN